MLTAPPRTHAQRYAWNWSSIGTTRISEYTGIRDDEASTAAMHDASPITTFALSSNILAFEYVSSPDHYPGARSAQAAVSEVHTYVVSDQSGEPSTYTICILTQCYAHTTK
jgi:hypothetical protein